MAESHRAPEVELPVKPGDILDGKYRVDSVLGLGGMGAVVAATHLQLKQTVAIKILLSSRTDRDEMDRLHRLLNEARIVARMKSAHVARVLDVGTLHSGGPYMVMELLEGIDLERYLDEQGPLPIDEAVDFLLQACEAIAEAHQLGVVHRDLKPSNLFLTIDVDKRPLVKVLDFGLSKTVRGDKAKTSITRPTEIVGTPSYMSPEQLRSTRDVDQRTDIWSLGVILYELLTNAQPFDNASIPDLCAAIVRDAPKPITSAVPAGVIGAILKCLEKNPDDRFQTVSELAEALGPFASDDERAGRIRRVQEPEPDDGKTSQRLHLGRPVILEVDDAPPPPRRSSRMGILLAVLFVAGGGALAGFLFIEFAAPRLMKANPTQAAAPAVTAPPPEPSVTTPSVTTPPPATTEPEPALSVASAKAPAVRPKARPPRPAAAASSQAVKPEPAPAATPTATTQDPDRFLETR